MDRAAISRRKLFTAAGAATLATMFTSGILGNRSAYAVTSAEKQAEANAAFRRLQELQTELDIKSTEYFEALEEEEAARARMEDAQRRIEECEDEILKLKLRLAVRVKSMYMNGDTSFLDILFGATSFQSFINNLAIMTHMNENDTDTVRMTEELKAEIEIEKAEYELQESIAEAKRIEAQHVMEEAQEMVAEMQAIYDSLSAEAYALLMEERAAEEARRAAEAAAAMEKARQEEEERRRKEEEERRQNGGDDSGSGSGSDSGSGSGSDSGSDSDEEEDEPPVSQDPTYYPSTGNAIVDRALYWVDKAEYVWAACNSSGQFDCSGFVAYCVSNRYQRLGTTWTFWNNNYGWFPRVLNPQPGDICVVHTSSRQHTGIYYKNGLMIHAADYGVGVIVSGVWADMVFCRYCGPVY